MASVFLLLRKLAHTLGETLNDSLGQGMHGLELTTTLPEKPNELPAIVFSFARTGKSLGGLGSVVVDKKNNSNGSTRVIKKDQISGQVGFQIWIAKSAADAQKKVEEAAELLDNLLEAHKNDLRTQGLLKIKLESIGPAETSKDPFASALCKQLNYNYVYEDTEGETEEEYIIKRIVVKKIRIDDKRVGKRMVIK